jgi:acyl-CoA thioesterase-1
MSRRGLLCLAISIATCLSLARSLVGAADAPSKEEPHQPRVLLIGDSISIGYTPFVSELLKGKAQVQHPKENCASTVVGLKRLDAWLGSEKWDVIHFNWGLHDLKYIKDEKGTITAVDSGKQWVPVEQYEKNLEELVTRLEKTGAKLIWATTTPVPEGTTGRVAGAESKYNEAAERIMKAHHIPIDDLNAIVKAHPDLQLPKNVHFTKAGYQELAASVVSYVEAAVATKEKKD